ncbi:helix-turn-helix domain-containing protein [Streptantibioticus ferralitis]|uniref:Helix-turn-helix transcriptional regulator n=1 Tax=Streptantibioticus ferralitis TaxID=236510 RepID=A0ABT5Z1R2_9ACTN|nr:helix-turn-helix transcriptional regulator [Streptantibioticus ferralitis]MDF2257783.1 helix-turn-helix transcriptional regulator [Streptantibioticus ferralitis]
MARPPRELTPYRSNRHFYGSEMRRCRNEADMTLDDLAAKVLHSRSQLHRVEVAEMMPPRDLSAALDEVFGTGMHFQRLYELVRQSQEIHPEQYRRLMLLEMRARVIETYAGTVVTGLVQTEPYARALFRISNPKASEEKIEEMVAARLSRQELLRSAPSPDLCVILDEAVIRRPVGGPGVMREQLDALVSLVDTAATTVQLLPYGHGEHALMGGALMLMTLDDGATVAYEESIDTGTLLEAPESVTPRQRKYDLLRSYALSPSETAAFIRAVKEEYTA